MEYKEGKDMAEKIQERRRSTRETEEVHSKHPAEEAGKKAVKSTVTVETDDMLSKIDEALETSDDELNDLLDQIDEALEEINAEEWVRMYVQKGGE